MDENAIKTPIETEESGEIEVKVTRAKKVVMIIAGILMLGVVVLAIIGWRAGLFTSVETLQAFLARMGIWAPAVFLLVQIAQIIVAIVPGGITCTVGVVAFGPVMGFIYNYVGIVVGSFLVFLLARRFGVPLIRSLVSPKTFNKYIGWLDKGQPLFNKLFAVAIFLPFAPDDLLCMIAGISKMPLRTYVLILVLCKIPFLIPYSVGLPALVKFLGI